MNIKDRIDNEVLLKAGLVMMRVSGIPLKKIPSPGRSMIYAMSNGEEVRVRTCNDHVLIVVADRPTEHANLNIEGTHWLLIVMPEVERTAGRIIAYLVPTKTVANAVRESHKKWLSSNPNTKGENTTWNLWFDKQYYGIDGRLEKYNYFEKWAEFRLEGEVSSIEIESELYSQQQGDSVTIKKEIDNARRRIAHAAAVSPEAVKISVEYA